MITKKDILSIDRGYFNVLDHSGFFLTLQSKNTKHYWHLVPQGYPGGEHFVIYHRHGDSGPYHEHGHAGNLEKVIAAIKGHDEFQITVRKRR